MKSSARTQVIIVLVAICIISASLSFAQSSDEVLADNDGNKYPLKVFSTQVWMTTNLKLNLAGSFCYENKELNCTKYGRLYAWESAKKGCNTLGEGWRLPTADEWRQLKMVNGGAKKDSIEIGKESYKALLAPGHSKFNALLGGGRSQDGNYSRINAHGFYWTATENDSSSAWFYNFGKGIKFLGVITDGEKARALSVRCVRNVSK